LSVSTKQLKNELRKKNSHAVVAEGQIPEGQGPEILHQTGAREITEIAQRQIGGVPQQLL